MITLIIYISVTKKLKTIQLTFDSWVSEEHILIFIKNVFFWTNYPFCIIWCLLYEDQAQSSLCMNTIQLLTQLVQQILAKNRLAYCCASSLLQKVTIILFRLHCKNSNKNLSMELDYDPLSKQKIGECYFKCQQKQSSHSRVKFVFDTKIIVTCTSAI